MHIDDEILSSKKGQIIIIEGSMFSGKTDELVNALKRAQMYAQRKVQAFKYEGDKRYGDDNFIHAHNGLKFPATPVKSVFQMYNLLKSGTEIIGIDEGQFFEDELIKYSLTQRNQDRLVIVSALFADAKGEQFKLRNSQRTIGDLLIHADHHIKKKAYCDCGELALYSQLKDDAERDGQVLIGANNLYEAKCPKCYGIVLDIIKNRK